MTSSSSTLNPAFITWEKQDALLLSWLLSAMLWKSLEKHFASKPQVQVMQLHVELQHLRKGMLPMVDYLQKAKLLANSLAVVGSPISEFDLNLRILMGLGPDYEAFVTSANARSDELSTEELNGTLLNHELQKEYFKLEFQSCPFSSNTAFRGPNNNNKSRVSLDQSSRYG
uniref:Retrovirus-related Pol polyprotein from transposon TNT 1-94 n=1 Tax=Nelumbo nucifera TaxID=4432 RepID=A0A822XKZ4_NELNU|nr:TPA_asm: hypothetical protein HUJ06_022135 [Nelumbo nucifera]